MTIVPAIDGKCEVAESFTGPVRKRARRQIRHIDSALSFFSLKEQ
jgi:hypothetical protein